MRTSLLSRSVIAVATLAVGSAALVAAPATATTPSGITRAEVLAAVKALRQDPYAEATEALIDPIVAKACAATATEDVVGNSNGTVTAPGGSADGAILGAIIKDRVSFQERICEFGVVAVADPAFSLAGTATLSADYGAGDVRTTVAPLSGDVAVTAPINFRMSTTPRTTFSTSGNATRPITSTTVVKVKDKKTKAEKKAAKKKYDKRLTAAKKSYKKALAKAGGSRSKKAAAKRAYSSMRASAKAKYRYAIAGYKLTTKWITTADDRPFFLTVNR